MNPQRKPRLPVESKQDALKAGLVTRVTPIVELVLKLASIAAIGAAGCWGWYQFNLGGNNGWMVNLSMTTKVLPYKDDLRLLVVHVNSKNPRNSTIEFIQSEHDSYDLTVRKLPDVKSGKALDIDKGELIAKIDLMPSDSLSYIFLPNAEFDDMATVVLPVGSVVSLSALLAKKDYDFVRTCQEFCVRDQNFIVSQLRW
ncbi:hypothetical protein [Collimonas antrihumi]|uniref:hypothetical protein n=1 Tax=Collimonas antrihumi TaxID=1940615 RepID=UPI001B8AED7F|nr:hypothetical protein [Collimonas antrihumi]